MGRMEPPRPVPRRSRRARRPGPGILAKIAADPATGGYWPVAGDGGILSFGAPYYGAG
jgi:hypothetical protein